MKSAKREEPVFDLKRARRHRTAGWELAGIEAVRSLRRRNSSQSVIFAALEISRGGAQQQKNGSRARRINQAFPGIYCLAQTRFQ